MTKRKAQSTVLHHRQIDALLQLPDEKLLSVLRVLRARAMSQNWSKVLRQEGLNLPDWDRDELPPSTHYERLDPQHEQNKTDTRHTIQRPATADDDDA